MSGRGPIRVLHVDDDPTFVDMATKFLEREDERIEVTAATRATEGLDRLAEAEFDCVVSDYGLPDRNGIDFLRAVREDHPDLPFVLFTGKGSEEVASEAISAGVTDYLQKTGGTDQYAVLANRIANAVGRYRDRREIQRLREEYRIVFEEAEDSLFLTDVDRSGPEPTFRVRRMNPANEAALGVSNEEGTTPRELLGDEVGAELVANYRRCLEAGEPISYEEELSLEGGTRIFETTLSPVWVDGEITRIVGVAHDVTERRERERELERQNDLFARAQDIASVGAWEYDVRTGEAVWTDEVYRIHGLPTDAEPSPGTSLEHYHPEDRPVIRDAFERAVEDGEPYDLELRLTAADGDRKWVRTRGDPQVEDGEVVRVRGTIQDVTDRRERERELERSERRYRTLAENFPNGGVLVFDTDLRYRAVHGEGFEIAGVDPATFEGERIDDVFDGETLATIREMYERTLAGDSRHRRMRYAGRTYRVHTVPLRDGDEVVGGIVMTQDVTEFVDDEGGG